MQVCLFPKRFCNMSSNIESDVESEGNEDLQATASKKNVALAEHTSLRGRLKQPISSRSTSTGRTISFRSKRRSLMSTEEPFTIVAETTCVEAVFFQAGKGAKQL